MTSTLSEVRQITIPNTFNRRLIARMWRAFRAERIAFPGGREKFADHIFGTIIKREEIGDIFVVGAETYVLPDNPPTPRTLDNFFESSAPIFEPKTLSEARNASIKTSVETLQYIYLFLSCVDFERVRSWSSAPPKNAEGLTIKGVTDQFEVFTPSSVIKRAFALVQVKNAGFARGTRQVVDYYKSGLKTEAWPKVLSQGVWPISECIYVKGSEDICEQCIVLNREQFAYLNHLVGPSEKISLDEENATIPTNQYDWESSWISVVRSLNILFSSDHGASVSERALIAVIKTVPKIRDPHYKMLEFAEDLLTERDRVSIMDEMQRVGDLNVFPQTDESNILIPLPNEYSPLFENVCEILA